MHEIVWTIVDDRGQPVAGATSTLGSARFVSDALGRASISTEAVQLPVVATAPAHTAVEATVTLRGANRITLQRILPLTVRAIDAADRPVSDVEIHIAPPGIGGSPQPGRSGARTAKTGHDGMAVLFDVPPGTWVIDARHADLVYSREAQANAAASYDGVAVFMPQDKVVTVRLVEPCVVAVEIVGGDILSCGFRRRGTALHSPSNPGGHADLLAKPARLQAEHPKASIDVTLLSYPSVDPHGIAVQATVWVAGRRPWQGVVQPVLLRDFRAPKRIALTDMPPSDEFGSVVVHLAGASGRELSDVRMQLLSADPKSPLFLVGQTPFNCERAVPGQLTTLPMGTWRLHLANPFLQRRADELGLIRVDRGSFREIRIGHENDWVRCHLCAEDGAPPAAGTFAITHLDGGVTVSEMVNDIRQGLEMWLPVGRIRLVISARQLGRDAEDVRLLQGEVEGLVEPRQDGAQRLNARVAFKP